ncbi:hypothetical protein [Streptomyces shenzhenensis]|uniref:Uncharacterized protein n=1 Tax=Streptomyces shenzhenensis TaxID=943815 RepID=A0A3M0INQ0_9ACTN|nr:hypothetical protein [Streptomyces shenzhenensis]RMB83666.1 hypothetical protein CTZ28_23400 [Streptomyces shenzhenensis]
MSSRTTTRAPKGRNLDRLDRRAIVANLLARAHRARLTPAEAALLGDYVYQERRLADENRRAMAGTTQALERHREAADAAIRELEQRAVDAERRHVEAVAEQQHTEQGDAAAIHLANSAATAWKQRAEQAEEIARTAHQCSNEAERQRAAAEQQLAAARDRIEGEQRRGDVLDQTLAEVRRRHRGACDRVDQVLAVLARVRNAQTLGDALAAVAEHDGLSPAAARLHARILDRADTVEARLAEQQREHEVALAAAEEAATTSERAAEQHRRALAAALARPAGTPFGDLTKYAAKTLTRSGERILDAEHRATRYRTAWLAARRDRKADRAAMAAELPLVQAGRQALTVAEAADYMRQWAAADVPAAQFVTTPEQPR